MESRILTLTRLLKAPATRVWSAWTDPDLLPRWFGPEGFHCRTKEIDLRQGGLWRFDMIGPDGTVFPNRHRYTLSSPPLRLDFLLDDDSDASPPFQVEVTLTPQAGDTLLTMKMIFPTAEARAGAEAFGAIELGQTTLAKLAALIES